MSQIHCGVPAPGGGSAHLEADRQVANTLAQLIIGGSLASIEIVDETSEGAA